MIFVPYVGANVHALGAQAPAQSGYRRHADLGRHHHGPLWPLSLLMAVPEVQIRTVRITPEKTASPHVLADVDEVSAPKEGLR